MLRPLRISTAHVEHLGSEVCVYDWKRNEVHALNPIAASVWQECDGHTTPAEIAGRLSGELKTDDAEALVWFALELLKDAHLLEGPVTLPSHQVSVSRRDLIKRLGQAAVLIPAISSIVAPTPLAAQSAGSQTFDYTGAAQIFVVPAGIRQITVAAYGAAGGAFVGPLPGGRGGLVTATIAVTPGEVLNVYVGGAGPDTVPFTPTPAGGFNGGGGSAGDGAGGGGASDIRRGTTRLVIAGGGGGHGNGGDGGSGGGTTAANGLGGTSGATGGGGGTQTTGGAGGTAGLSGTPGTAGSAFTGGVGGEYTGPEGTGGGGGGGGFFGGGGGGGGRGPTFPSLGAGGGGGGSSYADPAATNVTHTQGVRAGNGQIIISYL